MYNQNGVHVGTEQAGCTLHFGPSAAIKNDVPWAHFTKNRVPGFNEDFSLYKVEWTPTQIRLYVDNEQIGNLDAGPGLYEQGMFAERGAANPWTSGTTMAPFDREFYILLNLAVGGTNGFFDDNSMNRDNPKPW